MLVQIAPILVALLANACWCKPADDSSELHSPEELEAIRILKQEFENDCERNSASNVTYTEVMDAVADTLACFNSRVNLEELVNDWKKLNSETREEIFTKYCPVVKSTVVECLKPVEALSMMCMAPKAQRVESPDFPIYLLPQVVDLLCTDHGALIFAHNEESPTKCFENYFVYVKRCMKNFVSETNAKTRQNYSEVECRVLESSRGCVAEKLSTCGNADLIQVFDLPYEAVVRETPCKNYIQLSAKPT